MFEQTSEETIDFLHRLYAPCTGRNDPAYLTLTAIHPDAAHPTPSRHVPLGAESALNSALARLMAANTRGWGAYFGVALRQRDLGRWSRGGKEDLVLLPALYIDLDEPSDALFRFLRFALPPTAIVCSGKGYHAYWFLEEPTTDFVTADGVLRGLARELGGDDKMSVAQSMRLPGTRNTKPGRESALCTLVTFHPEWRYHMADFAPYAPRRAEVFRRQYVMHAQVTELRPMIDAVTHAVLHQLDGRPKHSGWIAARCPYDHMRDGPGQHFSYHPENGVGYCFGRHGKIPLMELARLLGVA